MITSKDNKQLKTLRYLKSKKGRDELGQFVIEGGKFIKEIPSNYKTEFYLASETYTNNNDIDKLDLSAPLFITKDYLFKQVSNTMTPQGILALVNKRVFNLETLPIKDSFYIILEDLQDPGNLGTLIRTADAAGVDGLILSKNSVDIYNPKVLRATAGSIFNIPIIEDENILNVIDYFKNNNINVYASHLDGEKYLYEIDFTKNIAIIVGNEGSGISKKVSEKSTSLIKIPIIGIAESLNASVASGILLYEVVRQRLNDF